MSNKCGICRRPVRRADTLKCSGDCHGLFHRICAADEFKRDMEDLMDSNVFCCDDCDEVVPESSPVTRRRTRHSTDTLTLADIMLEIRTSSATTNAKINKVGEEVKLLRSSYESLATKVAVMESQVSNASALSTQLKAQNDGLIRRVEHLEKGHSNSNYSSYSLTHYSTELVINGTPPSATDSPNVLVEKVFAALGTTKYFEDVLNVKSVVNNSLRAIARPSDAPGDDRPGHVRLIVTLRSTAVRDHIIQKKREKRDLLIKDVFGIDTPGQIYVNEYLPPEIYKLLKNVKAKAKQCGYKYVWVNSSRILVRKVEGAAPIRIETESDLDKLV